MASPHVGGAGALYLSSHTPRTPAQVEQAVRARRGPDRHVEQGRCGHQAIKRRRLLITAPTRYRIGPVIGTIIAVLLQATVALTTVASGTNSQISEPRETIVRSADEWRTLWTAHSTERIPTIDFSRFVVAGVFLGTRPTAGYTVEIVRVRQEGTVTTVEYREQRPASDAFTLQVLTQPFHLVRIPRAGTIQFRKTGPEDPPVYFGAMYPRRARTRTSRSRHLHRQLVILAVTARHEAERVLVGSVSRISANGSASLSG